jgi:hypothetical protein
VTYVGKDQQLKPSTSNKNHIVNKWLHSNMTMEKVQIAYGPTEELK